MFCHFGISVISYEISNICLIVSTLFDDYSQKTNFLFKARERLVLNMEHDSARIKEQHRLWRQEQFHRSLQLPRELLFKDNVPLQPASSGVLRSIKKSFPTTLQRQEEEEEEEEKRKKLALGSSTTVKSSRGFFGSFLESASKVMVSLGLRKQ